MNAPSTNVDRLLYLTNAVCAKAASDAELTELDAILRTDKTSHAPYFEFCRLHVALGLEFQTQLAVRKAFEQVDSASPRTASLPVSAPVSPLPSSLSTYFSSGWPVAYLIATVVFGIGLIVGALVHVSQPTQLVTPSSPHPSLFSPLPAAVARVTGMVDCDWEGTGFGVQGSGDGTKDPPLSPLHSPLLHLGDRLALKSGLLEITYDTGAHVILQGPVRYEVESFVGGYLSIGKLTARLEQKSEVRDQRSEPANQKSEIINHQFAVRTPTAIVTDLGTEFGVEVDKLGATRSYVYRGSVRVQKTLSNGKTEGVAQVLTDNQSACVAAGGGQVQVLPTRNENVSPNTFVRSLPKRVPIKAFNTGAGLKEGDPDPHWQIVAVSNDPSFRPRPALVVAGFDAQYWLSNDSERSQWISPFRDWKPQPHGIIYTYRTTFDLGGLSPDTARLRVRVIGDNHVKAVRINGRNSAVPQHEYEQLCYDRFLPVAITRGFVVGNNVLEIDVENNLPGVPQRKSSETGLRVELGGSAMTDWATSR